MALGIDNVIVVPKKTFLILNTLTLPLLLTLAQLFFLRISKMYVRDWEFYILMYQYWEPHVDVYAGTHLTVVNMMTHSVCKQCMT